VSYNLFNEGIVYVYLHINLSFQGEPGEICERIVHSVERQSQSSELPGPVSVGGDGRLQSGHFVRKSDQEKARRKEQMSERPKI